MAYSQREEDAEISCAMNDADDLDRLCFPDVGYYVGVEVPEAIFSAE